MNQEQALVNHFRKKLATNVSKGASRFYVMLSVLEHEQGGQCRPITTSEREASRRLFLCRNSLRQYCHELASVGAVEWLRGQGVLGCDAKGLQIRRRTLSELHSRQFTVELQPHTPANATTICETLNSRGFSWDGSVIRPHFAARSTGRIYTSGYNVQGVNEDMRFSYLLKNLPSDQFVVETDFRQADATVVRIILNGEGLLNINEWPHDIYDHYATLTGIPRKETKKVINKFFYCPSTSAYLRSLNIAPDPFIQSLADALEKKKESIWQNSRPRGQRPARVNTLGGTLVEGCNATRTRNIQPGTLFNWVVQGTVADILNTATSQILETEDKDQWRVLYPIHDSLVLQASRNCGPAIREIMESCATNLGIPLKTKCRAESNGSNLNRDEEKGMGQQ